MDTESIINKFKETFLSDIHEIVSKNQKRIVITIDPGSLPAPEGDLAMPEVDVRTPHRERLAAPVFQEAREVLHAPAVVALGRLVAPGYKGRVHGR